MKWTVHSKNLKLKIEKFDLISQEFFLFLFHEEISVRHFLNVSPQFMDALITLLQTIPK